MAFKALFGEEEGEGDFRRVDFPCGMSWKGMGCQKSSLLPVATCFPSFIEYAESDE